LFVYNNDRTPTDGSPNETGGRAESAALSREAGARSHRGLADVDTNDVEDVNNNEAKKEVVVKNPVVVVADKTTPKSEGNE
jgi:hypothetical protein